MHNNIVEVAYETFQQKLSVFQDFNDNNNLLNNAKGGGCSALITKIFLWRVFYLQVGQGTRSLLIKPSAVQTTVTASTTIPSTQVSLNIGFEYKGNFLIYF